MTLQIKKLNALRGGSLVEVEIMIEHEGNSERVALTLLSSQYAVLKPHKGEIDREIFDELENASKICEAYIRGENILSFGANTRRTLIIKLRRRGFDEEIATAAVELLRDRGYISEDEDMRREIERCLRKKWGSRRIIAHLHSKGYDDEALSLAENELAEIDFGELCFSLVDSKYDSLPRDPRERQKMIASLARYGYSMEEIRFALSEFSKAFDRRN